MDNNAICIITARGGSNSFVKRDLCLAQGTDAVTTPCLGHMTRCISATIQTLWVFQSQVRQERVPPRPLSQRTDFLPHMPQRHCSPLVGCALMAIVPSGKIFMSSIAVCLTFRIDFSIFLLSIHFPPYVVFFLQKISYRKMYAFSIAIRDEESQFPTHSDGVPFLYSQINII